MIGEESSNQSRLNIGGQERVHGDLCWCQKALLRPESFRRKCDNKKQERGAKAWGCEIGLMTVI